MLTASLAFDAGAVLFAFVVGIMLGADCTALSSRERNASDRRAMNRAIARVEDLEAELAHWKDRVATPAALMLSRPESRP